MLGREVHTNFCAVLVWEMQEPQNYWSSPQQSTSYYPFGMWCVIPLGKMPGLSYIAHGADENKFTYNGKELEDEFDLDWYHYGWRFYDPAVARWWVVDPKDVENGPYNFSYNDPIKFIDPDGAEPLDTWKINIETGEITHVNYDGGAEVQNFIYYSVENGEEVFELQTRLQTSIFYIGDSKNGYFASVVDLWEGLPDGYNTNSGYEYTRSDLRMRRKILDGGSFKSYMLQTEFSGDAGPLTASNFVKRYGPDVAMMKIFADFVDISGPTPSVKGLSPKKFNYTSAYFRNSSGTIEQVSQSLPSAGVATDGLNSWQIFLRTNKGNYKGLGLGKNWIHKAAQDYHLQK